MTADSVTLLNCPFCDWPAKQFQWRDHYGCSNPRCGAHAANLTAEDWNRRPTPKTPAATLSSKERISDARLAELLQKYEAEPPTASGWYVALASCLRELQERRSHETSESEPDWETIRRWELNYIEEVLLNIRKQGGEYARESANDTLAWLRNRLTVKATRCLVEPVGCHVGDYPLCDKFPDCPCGGPQPEKARENRLAAQECIHRAACEYCTPLNTDNLAPSTAAALDEMVRATEDAGLYDDIQPMKSIACPACDGTGQNWRKNYCGRCAGKGTLEVADDSASSPRERWTLIQQSKICG